MYLKVVLDGLSGKLLEDEGFLYFFVGVRVIWGVIKGKVCFECKVSMFSKYLNFIYIWLKLVWYY